MTTPRFPSMTTRSEEHTSELQSQSNLVCRLLLEKKAEQARRKNSVSKDATNSKSAILIVGEEDWPLPIPIVLRKETWYFDTKSGRDEICLRRICANELDAITVCRGFVNAQEQYALDEHA